MYKQSYKSEILTEEQMEEIDRKQNRISWLMALNKREKDVLRDDGGAEFVAAILEYRNFEDDSLEDIDITRIYLPITIRNC